MISIDLKIKTLQKTFIILPRKMFSEETKLHCYKINKF